MVLTNYNITALIPSGANKIPIQTITLPRAPIGSSLSLINVHSWSTYKTENIAFDQDDFRLLTMIYTPDSVYLLLTFVDVLCHCDQTVPISYFDLYHAASLQPLRRIQTQLIPHLCPWHMCQNLLTPLFSHSSARMAFCTTKGYATKEIQVSVVVLPNEMNLKSICRRAIIDYLNEFNGKIDDITGALPYRLSQYLQHRPEYQ